MRADLIIKNGTIVDGSGGATFQGDVAIHKGVIVAVGAVDAGIATDADVIDATGCIVTPGFVDIHTHYDGQAIWSDRLQPSSLHGVTTVVGGNCGVGFAPCRPGDRGALIALMEGVEDIPGAVMAEGLDWSWESFGEYLDAVDSRPRDVDFAAYIPHSPLRVFVMGARGIAREPANADDLAQMRAIVAQAMADGALGCATSRLFYHRTAHGELIPSHAAGEAELDALAQGMKDAGGGVLQVVPDVEGVTVDDELAVLASVARRNQVAVTFTATARGDPGAFIALMDGYRGEGLDLTAQIFPRPVGMIMGLGLSWNPFSFCPSFAPLADLSASERVGRMRDPVLRARLLVEEPDHSRFPMGRQTRNFRQTFVLGQAPNYEPSPDDSIAAKAERAGVSAEAYAYDALLEEDGQAMLLVAMGNYAEGNLDSMAAMIDHPSTVLGLGDGGAHYGLICDASYPTTLLAHWVRDRVGARIALPKAIRELSRRPAEVVGLLDRGLIAPGYKADVNVIDLAAMRLHRPEIVRDLPAGGRRLMQRANGYRATIVDGAVAYRDGVETGALRGRLVRGMRGDPTSA